MSFFGGSTETYVSSVAYNLAGDIDKRVNFLNTTVVSTLLRHGNDYMGETIVGAYRTGPGVKFRTFSSWVQSSGYSDLVGMQAGDLGSTGSINQSFLSSIISNQTGYTAKISSSTLGFASITYWAEQYLLENNPDVVNTDWTVDYSADTEMMYINLVGGSVIAVHVTGYNPSARYLYAGYNLSTGEVEGNLVVGPTTVLNDSDPYPGTTGYIRTSNSNQAKTLTLAIGIDNVISYSDGRPNETSHEDTSTVAPYTESHAVWEKTTYVGESDNGYLLSRREYLHLDKVGVFGDPVVTTTITTETISGGVTKTTTRTITSQTLKIVRSYHLDNRENIINGWSQFRTFIYQENSGNPDLDTMFTSQDAGVYFPFIPLRINNQFLSETFHADIYEKSKTAFRKATGGRLTKILDTLKDNDSINDIDFAYVVFGVSLNTKEDVAKKYLFQFFRALSLRDPNTYSAYQTYMTNYSLAKKSQERWKAWFEAQAQPSNPLYGTAEPVKRDYPVMPEFALSSRSTAEWMHYDMLIRWSWIREQGYVGQYKPGAVIGNTWVEKDSVDEIEQIYLTENSGGFGFTSSIQEIPNIRIVWQDTKNTYRIIRVGNLRHSNLVYNGKAINISAYEALDAADESGFIIPLQSQAFRDMGMKDMTQMSNACAYVVLNCYTEVKQKWYETGVFQVIVIIIIIIIAVYSGGTGAGLLGTNAGVGASLGFTGTAAIIVGAIANAVAAMILFNVITSASKAIFGDRVGAIVGTVATVVASAYGSAYMQGQDMSSVFANMMKADNLIKLTAAAGNGVADYMKAAVQDTMQATADLLVKYEEEAKGISEAYAKNLGNTGISLDPIAVSQATSAVLEYPDSFFTRTLMTGGDIAEMQNNLLTNFVSLTLGQKLPI